MKFLMTYTGDPSNPPPTPETFEALGKYTVEKIQSGVVVMTGGNYNTSSPPTTIMAREILPALLR